MHGQTTIKFTVPLSPLQGTIITLKTIDLGYEIMLNIGIGKLILRLEGAVWFALETYVCMLLQGGLQIHPGASDFQCGGAGQGVLS